MRFHQPTIDYVARRTAEGKSKREIIRCLKRYVAREIYHALTPASAPTITPTPTASSKPRRPPISVTISCGAGPSYRSRRRT
jgi:hypothetical protein